MTPFRRRPQSQPSDSAIAAVNVSLQFRNVTRGGWVFREWGGGAMERGGVDGWTGVPIRGRALELVPAL